MNELYKQIEQIETELSDQDDNAILWMEHGVGLHLTGRYQEAIESFRTSLGLDNSNPSCHFNLANSYLENGVPEKAIDHYRKAIDLKPDHIPSLTNLADAWELTGDLKKAHQTFHYLIQLAPDAPLSHFNLGNFFLRQNQHLEASRCYEKTLELDPTFDDAWYNIAWILEKVGATEQAMQYARSGLRTNPDNEELSEILQRLETKEKAS